MRFLRNFVFPVLLTVFLLLAVRGLLINHVRMPDDTAVHGLHPGQHVLVSLTYYGLRVPSEELWGYHRWGYRVPEAGDCLMFYLPRQKGQALSGVQTVGICRALPGETVWIDPVRKLILPARTSPDAQPIVIPGRNRSMEVTPYNARLLAFIMQHYEKCRVSVDADNRLMLDGRPMKRVKLAHDYFWIETRPDAYVLVPHEALIGKVVYAFEKNTREAGTESPHGLPGRN